MPPTLPARLLLAVTTACLLSSTACRAASPAPEPTPTASPAPPVTPAASPAPAAPPAAAPAIPPRDQADVTRAAEARVRALLATEAADRTVNTRVVKTSGGLWVVHGSIEGAYPGTGTRSAVVTPAGRVLGPRSPLALAELVRAEGWLAKAPAAATLVEAVGAIIFDGSLPLAAGTNPTVALRGGSLVLELSRASFPSQAAQAVQVTVGPTGPAAVLIAGKPALISISAVEELQAALASDDAAGLVRGVQALTGTTDLQGLATLARVTAHPNADIAASALMAIGSTAPAAAALKVAWSKLTANRRDALQAMAAEIYGDAFVARLR